VIAGYHSRGFTVSSGKPLKSAFVPGRINPLLLTFDGKLMSNAPAVID